MLSRYFEIKDFIFQIVVSGNDIQPLLLTSEQERLVSKLFSDMKKTKRCHKDITGRKCTLSTMGYIFDELMNVFPSTSRGLSSTDTIIHDVDFENGIVKMQQGNSGMLTENEVPAVSVFYQSPNRSAQALNDACLLLRAWKTQNMDLIERIAGYDDVRFILPSSNICDRLFSIAGVEMDYRRKYLIPSNFESQMILFANSNL